MGGFVRNTAVEIRRRSRSSGSLTNLLLFPVAAITDQLFSEPVHGDAPGGYSAFFTIEGVFLHGSEDIGLVFIHCRPDNAESGRKG